MIKIDVTYIYNRILNIIMAFVNSFLQLLSDGFSGTECENGLIAFLM